MSQSVSTVVVAEPRYAPGRFVLLRADLPDMDRGFVWCGRSLGWRPMETTSTAFVKLFPSEEKATEAADKYVTLPLQDDRAAD